MNFVSSNGRVLPPAQEEVRATTQEGQQRKKFITTTKQLVKKHSNFLPRPSKQCVSNIHRLPRSDTFADVVIMLGKVSFRIPNYDYNYSGNVHIAIRQTYRSEIFIGMLKK